MLCPDPGIIVCFVSLIQGGYLVEGVTLQQLSLYHSEMIFEDVRGWYNMVESCRIYCFASDSFALTLRKNRQLTTDQSFGVFAP